MGAPAFTAGGAGLLAPGDLHEFTGMPGLAVVALHALVLLGDWYISSSLLQPLVPFASLPYRPFEVALGQAALSLALPLIVTFYLRRRIGSWAFRSIHCASEAAFAPALLPADCSRERTAALGQWRRSRRLLANAPAGASGPGMLPEVGPLWTRRR
ncbi:MAG: hypothetical protein RMM58_14735 [Chloroflexota bacterium]|nr:hypothetical protein [Dehalococcoidia bacterium]MDW8255130.1 hypothetical protein [Chloroflexota bacterium]